MNERDKRRYEAFEEFIKSNDPEYIMGVASDIMDCLGVVLHYEPERANESVAHIASALLDLAIELRSIEDHEPRD